MRARHAGRRKMTVLALVAICCAHAARGAEPPSFRYRIASTDQQCCGVDSLYVCLRSLGRQDVSLASLERSLPAKPGGVSIEELVQTCRQMSYPAIAPRTDSAGLPTLGAPLIVHVAPNHFVALLGTEGGRLTVFDNSSGAYDCTLEWFMEHYRWREGAVVLIGSPPPYVTALAYYRELTCGATLVGLIGIGLLWHGRLRRRNRAESSPGLMIAARGGNWHATA